MRDDDICLAADLVPSGKIAVKSTKTKVNSNLPTLFEWCLETKCDRAIMNEVMFIVKQHSLPSKERAYVPYTREHWQALERELKITRTAITNLRKEIWQDEKNREFFYCKKGACRMSATHPTKGETRPEVKNLILKALEMQPAPAVASSECVYTCIFAPSLETLVVELGEKKPFCKVKYIPVVFLYSMDGKAMDLPPSEEIESILDLTHGQVRRGPHLLPARPTVWITSLASRDLLVEALKHHLDAQVFGLHSFYYVPSVENNFPLGEGEPSTLVTVNFTVPDGCLPGSDSYSKFTGFAKRTNPLVVLGVYRGHELVHKRVPCDARDAGGAVITYPEGP